MARNLEIEQQAIDAVMKYEKKNHPIDTHKKRIGYDVHCDDKIIEVKGSTEESVPFITLNPGNLNALESANNIPFFIYVVYDLKNKPKMLIINKKHIDDFGRQKNSIEVPLWVEHYRNCIEL